MKQKFVVLITGCSSGIGWALAVEFADRGHRVFATARKVETLADLREQGIAVLPLDVTRSESIEAAVEEALDQAGRIDILINNAGFGLMGPAVELSLDDLQRQLATNVIGPVAMAKAVAPQMIARGNGRIINVGSVSGILASPFAGAYCASKAALHSLSDSMRLELGPLGIRVISLQPGGIVSKFGDTAAKTLDGIIDKHSPFRPVVDFMEKRAQSGQEDAMEAAEFARRVVTEITRDNPPAVLRLGANSVKMPLLRWLLPTAMVDRILRKRFGLGLLEKS